MIWELTIGILFLPDQMHPEIIFLIENLCKFLSKRASLWDSRFSTPSLHFDLGKQTISQDALGGVFALISAHLHRQCFLYLSFALGLSYAS
jgi:hypothetical protein